MECGLGTNYAGWLATRATNPEVAEAESPDGYLKTAEKYVEDQYGGKKAALRPLYNRLLSLGLSLDDAKACPCKTMVPLYRNHVFAEIKPTTNTRIDLGLALAKMQDSRIAARLIDTGGKAKKDRITHRIPISGAADIDAMVEKWLRAAYELDAK